MRHRNGIRIAHTILFVKPALRPGIYNARLHINDI